MRCKTVEQLAGKRRATRIGKRQRLMQDVRDSALHDQIIAGGTGLEYGKPSLLHL
jgi:hypothetical protein